MKQNLRWKILVILGVTALGVWSFTPPSRKITLGLDLKGGIQLVMQVKTDDALKLESQTSADQLRQALKDANIPVTVAPNVTDFTVSGVPAGSDQQFRTIADQQLGTTYDREAHANGEYLFRMKPNYANQRRTEAVHQAILTIGKRVNELGVSEPVVAPYGTAADQIIVQLPGVADIERAQAIIQSTALLTLRLVDSGPAPDQATLLQPKGGTAPADLEVLQDTTNQFYLVQKTPAVTGSDLRNARAITDEYNTPAISFTLNAQGVTKFSRVTKDNVGKQLAIVLDNRIQSAPVIEGPIPSAEARITGRFTPQEAQDLALVLRSGALPAALTVLDHREVGPSLGKDSVRAGLMASGIGLVLVTIFMLTYYRLAGINAFVSIVLNLVILLGFMAYLGAVMTLPGIAGFILTIGMGVDSNVLIFERIREELELKKGARQAISASFDRVFVTIIDTHVSSLIAAAFLFQFGTGPIRGFATTLFFGLLSNVFTSVFVSRTLFELVLSRRPAGASQISI